MLDVQKAIVKLPVKDVDQPVVILFDNPEPPVPTKAVPVIPVLPTDSVVPVIEVGLVPTGLDALLIIVSPVLNL